MKTKNLMTAFALSAMFAACTQDAELNETLAKNDFSNIPMVEAEFTVRTGVESRLAKQWGWELQDKVGFAWLGATGMTIDGTAYQNNPLYCVDTDNASFKADGMFYVGKYFAYLPYTEGNHNIEAIKFNVSGQPLTTNVNDLAKHAIYISPKVYDLEKKTGTAADDANKLPSGIGNNLPLSIAQVSNAATINLTFANAEGLTDLKVYGISLNAKVGDYRQLPESFTYAPTTSATVTDGKWKGYSPATFYQTATATIGSIDAVSEEGVAVSNGALTVYMLTMPANTTPNTFEVKVNTNYGVVTVDLNDTYGDDADECIAFSEKVNGEVKEKTIATTSIFNNFGSAGTMDVYVDMDTKVIANQTVKTQAELEEKLNMLATAGYETPVTITVKPAKANKANNFVLTDFTLPEGLKTVVTLNAENASNGFVFTGNTVINKQIIVAANAAVEGTMTVNYLEDANEDALTTYNGLKLTVNNEALLVNNGLLNANVTTVAYNTTTKKAAGKYISNSEDADQVGGSFTNEGEIQWIAGTLPNATGIVYADVNNFQELLEADKAGVNTARFMQSVSFSNFNNDVAINSSIKNIEIYQPVSMYIYKKSIDGSAVDVQLGNVTSIVVKEGASLTVTSDLYNADPAKSNKITLGNNCAIKTEKSTSLSFNSIWMQFLGSIEYAGTVNVNKSNINNANLTQKEGGVYIEQ